MRFYPAIHLPVIAIGARCLLLLSLIALPSCGFHLRGAIQLPPDIDQLAIDDVSTTSQIAPVLRIELRRHDIKVLGNVDEAKYIIVVDSEQFSRRVMTVSPEGQVQEFELIYNVAYSILNKDNESASITGQRLTIRRGLRFDETAVLGKTSEETRLQQDMVSNAAEQILRRLQKVSLGATSTASGSNTDSSNAGGSKADSTDSSNNNTSTDSNSP